MNNKELINLEHYRKLIENRKFDEYDIIGFLVLIREYINKTDNPIFYDFANGIAHRKRNQGIIYDSMYFAVLNNYSKDYNGKVIGYHGVMYDIWEDECKKISQKFNIKLTPIIMQELLVCMFSIFHRSKFSTDSRSTNKEVYIEGSLEIIVNNNGSIALLTSDDINKLMVCFIKIDDLLISDSFTGDFILNPVETYRKNGFLHLRDDRGDILRVAKRK